MSLPGILSFFHLFWPISVGCEGLESFFFKAGESSLKLPKVPGSMEGVNDSFLFAKPCVLGRD
jgi:hypothetical protein